MNPKNLKRMEELKKLAFAFNPPAGKNHYKNVILPLLKLEGILSFNEFFKKLQSALQFYHSNIDIFLIAKEVLKDIERVRDFSPTRMRFEVILEHTWSKENAAYVRDVVYPLMNQYNRLPMREFNQQMQEALKPLSRERKRPKAISELLKHFAMHNQALSIKLKEENEKLRAKQAMLRKPLKFDRENGVETYQAVLSILNDAREMRQILERRQHCVKGKEFLYNQEHLVRWQYIEDLMASYLQNNKNAFKSNPGTEFKKLKRFLIYKIVPLVTSKDNVLKTDFAVFQNFIGNRVDAILKASIMTVSPLVEFEGKIDFAKRKQTNYQLRRQFINQFKSLGLTPKDTSVAFIGEMLGAYFQQLDSLQAGYDILSKQPPSDSNKKAIFFIEESLNRTEKLLRNIYSAFEKSKSLSQIEDNIYNALENYCKQDSRYGQFSMGELKQSVELYDLASKFLNHLSTKTMKVDPALERIYGQAPVEYGVLLTDEQKAQNAARPLPPDPLEAAKHRPLPEVKPQYAAPSINLAVKPPKENKNKMAGFFQPPSPPAIEKPKEKVQAKVPEKKPTFWSRFRPARKKNFAVIHPVYGSVDQVRKPGGKK